MGRTELQQLLDRKKSAKNKLFEKYWPDLASTESKNSLTIIFAGSDKKNHQILNDLLEGLLVIPGFFIVVSEEPANPFVKKNHLKFAWFNQKNAEKECLLDAADLGVLMHGENGLIAKLFDHGVVPVGSEKLPALDNYRPNEETGNSFTYIDFNQWGIFSCLVRAGETYKFPYDWQHIIRGMLKVR